MNAILCAIVLAALRACPRAASADVVPGGAGNVYGGLATNGTNVWAVYANPGVDSSGGANQTEVLEQFPPGGSPTSVTVAAGSEADEFATGHALTVTPGGDLWLLPSRGALQITAGGTPTLFPLSNRFFGTVTPNSSGGVWLQGVRTIASVSAGGQASGFTVPLSKWLTQKPGPANQRSLAGLSTAKDGSLWALATRANSAVVLHLTTHGTVLRAIKLPSKNTGGLIVAANGDVWVADNFKLYDITPATGRYRTFPVPQAPGQKQAGQYPQSLVQGPGGALWFIDDDRLGAVTPAGVTSLITPPSTDGPIDTIEYLVAQGSTLWYVTDFDYGFGPDYQLIHDTVPTTACTVPSLTGLTAAQATTTAQNAGCQTGPVTTAAHHRCPAESLRVSAQNPAAEATRIGQADIAITLACPA